MLKREWDAESNGKLPHLFFSCKTTTLDPELAVEDLPVVRTVTFVPVFAVKDLPLGRTLMKMMMMISETKQALRYEAIHLFSYESTLYKNKYTD